MEGDTLDGDKAASSSTISEGNHRHPGFLKDLCIYLREFLDTDFHKERAPKRKIIRKDKENRLMAIPLKDYVSFTLKLWDAMSGPVGAGFTIHISRGKYTIPLNRNLSDLLAKQIRAIKDEVVLTVAEKLIGYPQRHIQNIQPNEVVPLIDEMLAAIKNELRREIIVPLLKNIEEQIESQSIKGLDDIFDTEEELVNIILGDAEESIQAAINTAFVEKKFDEYEEIIKDVFDNEVLKDKLNHYFDNFKSSDLFNEILDVINTVKQKDNYQTYLYISDIKYEGNHYPLLYVPIYIRRVDAHIEMVAMPHLYINKKAVDYIAQKLAEQEGRPYASIIKERILYLENGERYATVANRLLDEWSHSLSIRPPLDLSNHIYQISQSLQTTASNALTIAAFEKSEEALLNDYEELLQLAETDNPVFLDFSKVIGKFLHDNPESYLFNVEDEWSNTEIEDRLVYESPVPLNPEQRKILNSLHKQGCRFIAVQGPPGTGKSHTITAIAFEAILKQQSVLILSDKTEALDVVEDKLTQTLNKVRLDDGFQNPLLRLGKSSNTYNKIFSGASMTLIEQNYLAGRQKEKALQSEIDNKDQALKNSLSQMRQLAQNITLSEVAEFHVLERRVLTEIPDIESYINNKEFLLGAKALLALHEAFCGPQKYFAKILKSTMPVVDMSVLKDSLESQASLSMIRHTQGFTTDGFNLFSRFERKNIEELAQFIRRYVNTRWPVFGFLFVGKKARAIDEEFGQQLACLSSLDMHKNYVVLRAMLPHLSTIASCLTHDNRLAFFELVYAQLLQSIELDIGKAHELAKQADIAHKFLVAYKEFIKSLDIKSESVLDWLMGKVGSNDALTLAIDYIQRQSAISEQFNSIPDVDYTGDMSELELLHTRKLAHIIDGRVVKFNADNKTLARSFKDIIKNKKKFPQEDFGKLQEAFPCIIANIRDYAEYVPLELGLFDLVIIDEASQVSIAQAFPAIIRSKKLLVLGDQNQFSNVKTSQASKSINTSHLNDIRANFNKAMQGAVNAGMQARLELFDIRTSILAFVEAMANYQTMLRKHFRGYPELISFSSKYFYKDQLQAVKLRGKPIDEVIEFTYIESDGLVSVKGNVNEQEYDAILETLVSCLEYEEPPSVGIITPFRDQQAYISREIHKHELAEDFDKYLKLKVMTFDSCQGEERDVIMYSMVASEEKDKLWTIFPKDIKSAGDVEEVLRLQRLNVGFSRAKEKVHFFLSEPLESFSGAIGEALRHFQRTFETATQLPDVSEVDPSSPMEARLLDWYRQTEFAEEYHEYVELIPQFPIGDYLKQIDPNYKHPAYRVDFLLRYHTDEKIHNIVIEYDGFKEHFTDLEKVTVDNYHDYYKPDDIEREKVLESYGYHVMRVNRFNLGQNQVETLNRRLYDLVSRLDESVRSNGLIDEINQTQEGLQNGDTKLCPKCKTIKPVSSFEDASLISGKARHCSDCRKPKKSFGRRKRSYSWYRR